MSTGAATWEGTNVPLGQLEAQMQRLWRAADVEWDGEGRRPDIRTSVLNLIVYARDQSSCDRTVTDLERLSGTHPSRAIVIVPGRGSEDASVDCRLSIHSHGAYADYRQVCSEQLILWIHGQAIHHLASVVMPLLAPDLPAFVWWPGETPFHHHVYGQLRDVADRFIVDSSDFSNPAADLVAMARAVHSAGAATAFSDFNWARIAPWRELLASFFDLAQFRPYLDHLKNITIECTRVRDGSAFDAAQALLILGWIAAALGLYAEERQLSDKEYAFHLVGGAQSLSARVLVADGQPASTIGVTVQANGDPPAEFSLSLDRQSGMVAATASLDGSSPLVRKTTMLDLEEAHLLFKELEVFGHDAQFERSLLSLSNLLNPNYHREPVRGSLLV